MKNSGKKLVTILFSGLLFVLVFVGPWMLLSMASDNGIGCPFMPGQESVCSMTVFDHISHWQNAFATILVEVLKYPAVVGFTIFVLLIQRRHNGPPLCAIETRHPTLFQELFSQGILNSKTY